MTELGGKKILIEMGNGTTQSVTFQNTGETVTLNSHGLAARTKVRFSAVVTTTTISTSTNYFVINPTTNTFQVALTEGGSAVAIDADGTGTLAEVFRIIGGLRTKTLSIASEAIDVTNQDSSEWKKILDDAGVRSVSLSAAGVFEDGTIINLLRVAMMANTLKNFRIYVTTDYDYFAGSFKITSFENSGEYNAENTYSISMESSGEVTYNTF